MNRQLSDLLYMMVALSSVVFSQPRASNKPKVMLTWNPSSSGNVTQQYVYRGTGPNGENYNAPIIILSGNTVGSYLDEDNSLKAGKTYCYVVKAYDGARLSAPSNEFCMTLR